MTKTPTPKNKRPHPALLKAFRKAWKPNPPGYVSPYHQKLRDEWAAAHGLPWPDFKARLEADPAFRKQVQTRFEESKKSRLTGKAALAKK